MTLTESPAPVSSGEPPQPAGSEGRGLAAWLTTTDHKRLGTAYVVTAVVFLLLGGAFALVIRTELATPQPDVVDRQVFAEMFTMHGTVMVFLFLTPLFTGFATYMVPLQVGAPDMAFPRLNALGYWLFVAGSLVVLSGFATMGGAAGAGWTGYAPLSSRFTYPGPGVDLWAVGLIMIGLASIANAVNLIATVLTLRAPGMTMWRLPIFCWDMVVQSILVLFAFPPIALTMVLLLMDRRLGSVVFDATHGGSAILYQHLFWFFGHPEVYVLILPAFGVVTEIFATFSRKPVFGYTGLVLATLAIAGLGMTVWAHHMFTTGAIDTNWFSAASFLIAIPTGIKIFDWIGTMWGGKLRLDAPLLFALGFVANFLIGGITGVMVAAPPIDYAVHDTYFVVAHFHQVLVGGALFAAMAGLHYWFPKITGSMMREGLAKVSFAFVFVGYNLTFVTMMFAGLRGMPRRINEYDPGAGWTFVNQVTTVGAFVMGVGVLLVVVNLVVSLRRKGRRPAGDNPWDGHTLEWATTSPPPPHNFDSLPPIRSERPVFDQLVAEGKLEAPEGVRGGS
ncbi:MAG: cytochrome c oxidase subunit I [Acidimicrobiia bacterium]